MSDLKIEKPRSFYNRIKHILLPIFIIAIGGGSLVVLKAMKKDPEKSDQLLANSAPLVLTEMIDLSESGITITVDGVVVPSREVKLAAEVSGRVLYTRDGCKVGKYRSESN